MYPFPIFWSLKRRLKEILRINQTSLPGFFRGLAPGVPMARCYGAVIGIYPPDVSTEHGEARIRNQ